MLSITAAELRHHARNMQAYGLPERLEQINRRLGHTVADDEQIPLSTWAEVRTPQDGVPSTPLFDLLWAFRCCWDRGGRGACVEVAIHLCEQATPSGGSARQAHKAALVAARGYIAQAVSFDAASKVYLEALAANQHAAAVTLYAAFTAEPDFACNAAMDAIGSVKPRVSAADVRAELLKRIAA